MSSLFLRTTKSLVRELGRKGELVPVDSLSSSPRLRPFCLVRKKHRRYLWPWDTPLIPTDFSLLDLLEPGLPEPEVNHSSPINIWDKVAGELTAAVSLSAGLQGQVTGGSNSACISALAVQTLWVSPCTWEMLLERRKLRSPRPSFLQELQSRKERESLYVVTEAVETLQDAVLQSQGQTLGAGQLSLLQLGHVQVQIQSHRDTEKVLSIPQGSILAYRVLQLVVEEDGWAVLYFPERKLYRDTRRGIAFSQDSGEVSNLQSLQEQADGQLQDLATLSSELRGTLLGALQELLQDRQALQELEDTLEQALDTGLLAQLKGSGGFVLSILQDSTGNLSRSRGKAILYILGALAALSEPQLCLLAQSIERRILSEELELHNVAVRTFKVVHDMLTCVLLLGSSNGSEVTSTGCSSRGPEFKFQQPSSGSQPPMRSDALSWLQACIAGMQDDSTAYTMNKINQKKKKEYCYCMMANELHGEDTLQSNKGLMLSCLAFPATFLWPPQPPTATIVTNW
ncbi:RGD1359449 [Phodopus roborovskii]|uniref:RGD1359449 protein n=1 Tax=Phodopus roborovskii TaxID=109678 RepID=A0AAV0A059_PHORO|nr:RGD1359449 [Phodopus roborovskii]